MSLAWLYPAGFVALSALLLPLLIHLRRHTVSQRIDFAALRWLKPAAHRRRRFRIQQWPLLLLRLLLLALLAALLARPALTGAVDATPRVVLAPGVNALAARQALGTPSAQWRWLAPGFPPVDANPSPPTRQPVASLLRELDARLPSATPLTVVVPDIIDGLDAQRPQLSRQVQWKIVAQATPASKSRIAPPPRIAVRHDAAGAAGVGYLRAVARAWSNDEDFDDSDDSQPFVTNDGLRVWLSAKDVPPSLQRWASAGGQLLVDARTPLPHGATRTPRWRDDDGRVVLEQVDGHQWRWWRWAAPLQPSAMPALLEADFPTHLKAQLEPLPPPQRALASAARPLVGAAPYPQSPRELSHWLLVVIAATFLAERWLAGRARDGDRP